MADYLEDWSNKTKIPLSFLQQKWEELSEVIIIKMGNPDKLKSDADLDHVNTIIRRQLYLRLKRGDYDDHITIQKKNN